MPNAKYVPPIFHFLGLIAALYAAVIALSHEFPPNWGWAFAPFGIAVLGITIIGVVTSLPRGMPSKEAVPILRTGIKMGAIMKLFFVLASFIGGAYVYWFAPVEGPPGVVLPPGLGWEGAGGLWVGVSLALALSIIGDIVAHKGLGMMLKHGGGE